MIELLWQMIAILALAAAAHASTDVGTSLQVEDRQSTPKYHAVTLELPDDNQDSVQYVVAPSR